MRVAVIGGGTAGAMAAARVAHRLPEAELTWVHDPARPPLGVGEGTLPPFPPWLHEVTGLDFPELRARAGVTFKLGVRFEGWGGVEPVFRHDFSGRAHAYHLSADRLVPLLAERVPARREARRVSAVESDGRSVRLSFDEGGELVADLVFDARGFPPPGSPDVVPVPWVTANAALLRRGPLAPWEGGTRAIARPHGWVFAIPLAEDASYGYLFDERLSDRADVEGDFAALLEEEGVPAPRLRESGGEDGAYRLLRFPSFRRRRFFDGALLAIGSTASFLEPLEATAIGLAQHQIETALLWVDGTIERRLGVRGRHAPEVVGAVDAEIAREIDRVGLFVAWHYVAGSVHDTPFWRQGLERWRAAEARLGGSRLLADFRRLLVAASAIPPDDLARVRDPRVAAERIMPRATGLAFGGFAEASFAQIARGLGLLTDGEVTFR